MTPMYRRDAIKRTAPEPAPAESPAVVDGTAIGGGLEAVLAAHILYGNPDDGDGLECGCKWTPSNTAWEEDFGEEIEHRAHVVAAMRVAGFGHVTTARAEALREAADVADRATITGLETTRPDLVAIWLRARADREAQR